MIMTSFRRGLTGLALVLSLSAPLSFAVAAEKPYVTATEFDIRPLLPPPVAAGSSADMAQRAAVLAAQKAASSDRIALAAADGEESVFDMYTRTFGPGFNKDALPKIAHLFERVGESEDAVVDAAKPFFGRVRPYLADSEIKPLVKPSKSGSYPSGHTTRVTAVAGILVAMIPEKRDVIWQRAVEYAQSRVVGGMHYPEDLEAGYRAGTALAAVIMANPEFKADFPAAREELRKALGL
jgi:acid phosphatase (class A)